MQLMLKLSTLKPPQSIIFKKNFVVRDRIDSKREKNLFMSDNSDR